MTQIFREDGEVVPVTVLEAGPCVVVQRKTVAKDGYEAAQLGLVESRPRRHATKASKGHFAKSGTAPTRFTRELRLQEGGETKPGDVVLDTRFRDGRMGVNGKKLVDLPLVVFPLETDLQIQMFGFEIVFVCVPAFEFDGDVGDGELAGAEDFGVSVGDLEPA